MSATWALLPLVLATAQGCAHSKVAAESRTQVEELTLRFTGPGRANLVLQVSMEVNGEERAESVDYELRLNGRYFAAGVSEVGLKLYPPKGKIELDVPLSFRPLPTLEQPQSVRANVRGGIRLNGGIWGEVRYPFEREFTLSLAQMPILEDQGAD